MDKNRDDDSDKEDSINFALLIEQIKTPQGFTYNIQSHNQGISTSDIILLAECWLEKVKDNFKKGIKDNIFFHDDPANQE